MNIGAAWHWRAIDRGRQDLEDDINHSGLSALCGLVEGSGAISGGPEWAQNEGDTVEQLQIEQNRDEGDRGPEGDGENVASEGSMS
jgi:hypothetical protein